MNGSLYRYKTFSDWGKDRFLSEIDDIKNNRITLVSPELFNDPYDCLIPFFENISEEEFNQILKPHIIENLEREIEESKARQSGGRNMLNYEVFNNFVIDVLNNSFSVKNLTERFEKWFPSFFSEYLDEFGIKQKAELYNEGGEIWTKVLIGDALRQMHVFDNNDFSKKIDLTQKQAKVACFSKNHNSMYFWSHYANSHKGICLEYSFKPNVDLIATPEEIQYCPSDNNGTFIKKFYSKTSFGDNFLFMTKSKDWAQEEEIRIAAMNVRKWLKETSRPEEFLEQQRALINAKALQKLDGSVDNVDGRRNLEKCECGEFRYRYYSRLPSEKDKACAQIYCENCDDKKGSKSILKHEYSYQPITKIYLGLRFDEDTESAKRLIEATRSQNIPVYKMKLSRKKFSLEEELY